MSVEAPIKPVVVDDPSKLFVGGLNPAKLHGENMVAEPLSHLLVFFDVETTGTERGDDIIQLAYRWYEDGKQCDVNELFSPFDSSKMKPESMAIHHITPPMLEGKPMFIESATKDHFLGLIASGYIPVAHNAKFDVGMMRNAGVKVNDFICTFKLARALDKEGKLASYSLQYLRYYFEMYDLDVTAHDAMGDVIVLEKVFEKLAIKSLGLDDLIKISQKPSFVPRMPFGKHKGVALKDVPRDYVQWLRGQWESDGNVDEDLDYSFKKLGF